MFFGESGWRVLGVMLRGLPVRRVYVVTVLTEKYLPVTLPIGLLL